MFKHLLIDKDDRLVDIDNMMIVHRDFLYSTGSVKLNNLLRSIFDFEDFIFYEYGHPFGWSSKCFGYLNKGLLPDITYTMCNKQASAICDKYSLQNDNISVLIKFRTTEQLLLAKIMFTN